MKHVVLMGIDKEGKKHFLADFSYADDAAGVARDDVMTHARERLGGVLNGYEAVVISGDINLTLYKDNGPREAYSERDLLSGARQAAQWFYHNQPLVDEAAIENEASDQAHTTVYGVDMDGVMDEDEDSRELVGYGGLKSEFFNIPPSWEGLYRAEFIAEYHRLVNTDGPKNPTAES